MNSYERVMQALSFKESDRVPLVLSNRFSCIKQAGYTLGEVLRDVNKFVDAQEKAISDFNLDAAWDLAGVYYMSQAMGQNMAFPESDPPLVLEPFIHSSQDLTKLANFKPENAPILEYQAEMNRKLRARVGKDMPLITWIESPFFTACMLRGAQELYMDIYKEPNFIKDLVGTLVEVSKKYAYYVAKENADIIYTACPQASKNMISKKTFQEFVHPSYLKVFDYWRNALGKKILFHVCGDWADRFDLLIEEMPDILHVDIVDLKWLNAMCYGKVTVNGNVSTTKALLLGTPDEVEQEARACIEAAAAGGGFLLGADCTLARDTPAANIQAMATAVTKYGVYPSK
jgi:uroporphyrinogen decarboxylase